MTSVCLEKHFSRQALPGSTSRPFPEAHAVRFGHPAQAEALPASSAAGPTHPSLAFAGMESGAWDGGKILLGSAIGLRCVVQRDGQCRSQLNYNFVASLLFMSMAGSRTTGVRFGSKCLFFVTTRTSGRFHVRTCRTPPAADRQPQPRGVLLADQQSRSSSASSRLEFHNHSKPWSCLTA